MMKLFAILLSLGVKMMRVGQLLLLLLLAGYTSPTYDAASA